MARMLYLRDIEVDVHVRCRTCGHEGVLPRADMSRRFGPNYPVLSIAPHYRCSKCDSRDTESRPAPPPLTVVDGTFGEEPAEAAPSFAGPLAALQGLLDAVRGRDEAGEDEVKEATARAPIDTAPAHKPSPTEPDIPLEQLIADGPGGADDGRRPLWEPISLADMAARLQEDEPAADGLTDAEPTDDVLTGQEPAPAVPEGQDEEPEDDLDLSRFDRTLAALRAMVDGDDAEDRKDGGRQAGTDAPRPEPEPVRLLDAGEDEDDEGDDGMPPVFSVQSLVRTDFEDDLEEDEEEPEDDGAFRDPFGFHDEPSAEEPEDEPSEEEIVAFAIRDPEKPLPRRERPAPAEDMPLDKTIAALRDMVQEAAADPEESDGRRVVTPFSRPRPPVFDRFEDEPEPTDRDPTDRNQGDEADAEEPEDAPPSRKSAQEMEMEEALRALRALVEEEDPDEPPPAAVGTTAAVQKVAEDEDEGEDEDEPLDLVNMLKNEGPSPPRAEEPKRAEPKASVPKRDDSASGDPMSGDSASDGAKDDHSPLNKTIAALRSMLELDGKRGR